jgi:hypothetical protein
VKQQSPLSAHTPSGENILFDPTLRHQNDPTNRTRGGVARTPGFFATKALLRFFLRDPGFGQHQLIVMATLSFALYAAVQKCGSPWMLLPPDWTCLFRLLPSEWKLPGCVCY